MESSHIGTIGIVREEKNKWERRVAVTPKEVKYLVDNGVKVIVQPMTNRCFTKKEFEEAGAVFQEDLSEAELIVGVKEVPIDNLIPNKTYLFFSHTIKAQDYNMPLLDKLLESNIRLVDYECIREDGQRLVAFGRYAGIAGVVDFLRGIGEYLLEKKFQTFFVNLGSTYMYLDLDEIKESISKVGKNIAQKGLPDEFAPYVFAITSKGRVSKGAAEILELLPHEYVEPDKLGDIPKDSSKIYITVMEAKDLVEANDESCPSEFDKEHYYDHPDKYKSKFHTYYDKVSFLVNCMYWEPKFPRVIIEDELIAHHKNMKFMGFTDISADYEGSIEVTREFSDIEAPYNLYRPTEKRLVPRMREYEEGDILYHCVDHLPAEMPIEASRHFGEKLCPFLIDLMKGDLSKSYQDIDDIPDTIKQAIICTKGSLTPNYRYIEDLRKLNERQKEEDEKIASLKHRSKGLKRAISFTSLQLKGHIFDNRFFNDTLDLLEKAEANFRILNIRCGQRTDEKSAATLQIFSHDSKKINQALMDLFDLSDKMGVKIIKNYEDELDGNDDEE